jgi:hypothetical protein
VHFDVARKWWRGSTREGSIVFRMWGNTTRVACIWEAWYLNKGSWGSSPSFHNVLHQATTSFLEQGKQESKPNTFWELDSDCRITTTCMGHHGFIRTPIGTFLYLMESLWSLLSNGSNHMSISHLSRVQSLFYCRNLFCLRCCVTLFWANGPCIGCVLGLEDDFSTTLVILPSIYLPLEPPWIVWVLFRSSLAFATCL